MDVIGADVSGELVGNAVESEGSATDAVGVTSGDGAEEGVFFQVGWEGVKAEHDIGEFFVAVGDGEGDDDAAVIGDADLHSPRVSEGEEVNGLAIWGGAPGCGDQGDLTADDGCVMGDHESEG